MTLKLHRPTREGLEPRRVEAGDWRTQLGSRRWRVAPLENPEVRKTNPWMVVLAIAVLAALTFVTMVAGYVTGFWGA
jgi:hypothetical protein